MCLRCPAAGTVPYALGGGAGTVPSGTVPDGLSRRSLLLGGAVAAASLHTGVAEARISPANMVPLVGPGFKPVDRDEQGLWKEMERAEEEIAGSNLLIQDPKLTGYLKHIIGTVGGPAAQDFRRGSCCACATRRSWRA